MYIYVLREAILFVQRRKKREEKREDMSEKHKKQN